MRIGRSGSSGYFAFMLDSKELSLPQPHWLGFIEALKRLVPAAEREYRPTDKSWTIEDKHFEAVMELRNEWFTDKNQTELF